MDTGIFKIDARRCLRCGRLLTSSTAVKEGYGDSCKKHAQMEENINKPMEGQFDIFNFTEDKEDQNAKQSDINGAFDERSGT